jgi:hypothetical protein
MCHQREEPPTAERYEQLSSCDIEPYPTAIRGAMFKLGPSFEYTLYVHPMEQLDFSLHAREWTQGEFAFQLNVYADKALGVREWYLAANGRRVGSKGVG